MLALLSNFFTIMFALMSFGFAQIHAEEVPRGIMPKRQVAGTGSTTTTSPPSTTSPTSTPPTTSDSSTISTPPTTTTPTDTSTTTPPTTTPTTTVDPVTTPPSSTTPTDTPTSTPDTTTPSAIVDSSSAPSSSDAPASSEAVASSSAADSSAAPVSSADVTSSTELPTTVAVTTTNADGSTITSSVATSTLVPASTRSAIIKTETGSASNVVVFGSSTINRSTLSSATTITTALVALETEPSTYTSYWTTDGSVMSKVITTDRVFSSTTGFATATIKPSFANGGGSGTNLSTSSKKIVGGVVGGIGGAILIGGLALVAWRLWGKNKRQQLPNDDDYLDSQNDSIRREKSGTSQPAFPQYQNPNGAVNTASNF